jgi:putative CocE/NonD family hydrolase
VTTVSRFPRAIREIDPVWIPLADGTRLAAKVWLPADAEARPVPAILEYLPYRRRDFTAQRDALMHPYVAGHGYACVRVDIRGSGDSDGVLTDEYLPLEQEGAVEVIAWLARQPWCSGAVGMIGNSWGGFNALQVAARRPPALKAIITSCSTDDRYADDVHYMGGCLLVDKLRWASTMFSHNARPPDPAVVGERWRAMWLERLRGSGLWLETWLRHQRRDAYYQQGSVCEDFGAITVPVLAVGGWADAYTNAIPRLLTGLSGPRQAIIGQWAHRYPHMALPGPAIGFLQIAVRWWDNWLKGLDTGVTSEPMLRAFMLESVPPAPGYATRAGRWLAEPVWPSHRVRPRRLVLNPGRLDDRAGPETPLTVCTPETVGLYAGRWCPYGSGLDLPGDQRWEDGAAVVFDTEPLVERLEILGAPVADLVLASDQPVAQIAARLSDVAPDGAATRVSYGLLNLAHRDSHESPTPLSPGRRCRVRLQLNDVAQAFPPGHRIRLALSTSYWPMAWPAPATATLTLVTGASTLNLPVRAAGPAETPVSLPPVELPPPLPTTVLEPARQERVVARHDVGTGEVALESLQEGGRLRYDDIDLTVSTWTVERFTIRPGDPASARGEIVTTVGFERGEWRVETRTRTTLTGSADAFRVVARLEAFEGGTPVHHQDWDLSIPRDLV